MQLEKELFDKIYSGAIGEVPLHKGKLYVIANAYIAAYENKYLEVLPNEELLDFCSEVNSYLPEVNQEEIHSQFNSFSKEDLRKIVYFSLVNDLTGYKDFVESSTEPMCELVQQILDIDGKGHIVADLGSGNGGFLAKVIVDSQKKRINLKGVVGYEINLEQARMSQMALDILSGSEPRPIIKIGNIFDNVNLLYTRGYCFPPIGLKQVVKEKAKPSRLFDKIEFTARNTSEWLFVDQLLSGLETYSKAVAVVSGRALFNYADEDYRASLIKEGLLEAIVELPAGSLNYTSIKPYLLVFSRGNKSVKLVDASEAIDAKQKRYNKIELSVEKVMSMLNSPSVPTRDNETLKDITNLVPSSILVDVKAPKNAVPLGGLAEVFTGNQYTLGVFEKNGMLSSEPTEYRILTSSDIEDGVVDWKSLRFIKYDDNKFDKYALRKNDIVVTSKSSKVKTVVVDIEPKEKILVTGGMIIVRPNIDLINPTYLKIFLDSEQGQNALKAIQKGSIIITINSKDLSTVLVPVIDIKRQNERAQKYNEKLSTLYALKQEIRKLEDSLKNFYLDESEDM